jgi:hypothetical protein
LLKAQPADTWSRTIFVNKSKDRQRGWTNWYDEAVLTDGRLISRLTMRLGLSFELDE